MSHETIKQDTLLLHQQWLQHPITKQVKSVLEAQSAWISKSISDGSMNQTIPDNHFRQLAVQLKTIETIKTLLYDSEKFTNKITST